MFTRRSFLASFASTLALLTSWRPGWAQTTHTRERHVRAVQRFLPDGRAAVSGRQDARRLRAPRRRGEGRARAGARRGPHRDRGAWRRHALALGDVRARPRRAHRRAHQHDRAGHFRAGQSRVRFRQGDFPRAHGRGDVPALRRELPRRRRRGAAALQGPLDRHRRRRAHRADRNCLRAVAAHVLAGRPALRLMHRHHEGAGRGAAAARARISSARSCIAIAATRSSCSTSAPPNCCSPATRTTCSSITTAAARWSSPATTRITSPASTSRSRCARTAASASRTGGRSSA